MRVGYVEHDEFSLQYMITIETEYGERTAISWIPEKLLYNLMRKHSIEPIDIFKTAAERAGIDVVVYQDRMYPVDGFRLIPIVEG